MIKFFRRESAEIFGRIYFETDTEMPKTACICFKKKQALPRSIWNEPVFIIMSCKKRKNRVKLLETLDGLQYRICMRKLILSNL